ncbi:MAG: CotH kinase family protein [Pirellulaceae bacterium]
MLRPKFGRELGVAFLIWQWLAICNGLFGFQDDGDRVFGNTKVNRFELKMSAEQFTRLTPDQRTPLAPKRETPPQIEQSEAHRNTFGIELPWSQAELVFNGKTYPDVGVRYKGNYTFMATMRLLKKSLKIDLNRNVSGQKLDGLTMLNLNCGITDPTFTRETISYWFLREVGVPAPRTAFAQLLLTVPEKYEAELVGTYTLVEQVNKSFLKHHFGDGSGMLLKPEGLQGGPTFLGPDWSAYEAQYRPEKDPTSEQKNRLMEFTKLISQSTDEEFSQKIHSYLDLNAFLTFIAANTLLSNLDSYLGIGHNYYLYLDPESNRFYFIPWDLDLSLATWPAVGTPEQLVELSILHPHAGKNQLLDRILQVDELRQLYRSIFKGMYETHFTLKKLNGELDLIEAALREPLAAEALAFKARNEDREQGGLGKGIGKAQFGQSMPPRRFFELRMQSVTAQLAGEPKGFEPKPFGVGFAPNMNQRPPVKNSK